MFEAQSLGNIEGSFIEKESTGDKRLKAGIKNLNY